MEKYAYLAKKKGNWNNCNTEKVVKNSWREKFFISFFFQTLWTIISTLKKSIFALAELFYSLAFHPLYIYTIIRYVNCSTVWRWMTFQRRQFRHEHNFMFPTTTLCKRGICICDWTTTKRNRIKQQFKAIEKLNEKVINLNIILI